MDVKILAHDAGAVLIVSQDEALALRVALARASQSLRESETITDDMRADHMDTLWNALVQIGVDSIGRKGGK